LQDAELAYNQKCQDAFNDLYGKKQDETEAGYMERLKPFFNEAYYRIVNMECERLKQEILRLKNETKGLLLTSRVFTYHAAQTAMDVRLSNEAYQKLKTIKETEKPPQGAPGWFKWGVLLLIIAVGLGVMVYLIMQGVASIT
jgi:hypothetical protein